MAILDKLQIIASCPLFRGLEQDVLQQLAAVSYIKRFSNGTMIHAKGDPPEGLIAVVTGKAKVSSIAPDGKEMLFTVLESGSWFGEIALFDGRARSHDVYAMDTTEFLLVPSREFHRILDQQPHLYPHFMKLICSYVRVSYGALEDQTFLDLPARLAKRLLILADGFGVLVAEGIRVNLQLSQDELARMMGVARQSVSKELNNWERKGWIEIKYGRVLIRDRQALERLFATPKAIPK